MSCVVGMERIKDSERSKSLVEEMPEIESVIERHLQLNEDISPSNAQNEVYDPEESCNGSLQNVNLNEHHTTTSFEDKAIEIKCEEEPAFEIIMDNNVTFITSDPKLSKVH